MFNMMLRSKRGISSDFDNDTRKLFTVKIAVATKRVSIIFLRLFNPEGGTIKQLTDNSFYSFPIMYVLYPSKEHFAMILIQCNI